MFSSLNNPSEETILIISASDEQAEKVKTSINLRGQESIITSTFNQANETLQTLKPTMAILDLALLAENQIPFVKSISQVCPVLILSPKFQEDFFLNVYDAGAHEFLVKPVPESYLAARILSVLEQQRKSLDLEQRNQILRDYDVVSERSSAFSTSYILKLLKTYTENAQRQNTALSFVLIEVNEIQDSLSVETQHALYNHLVTLINGCARGSDIIGEYLENKFAIILPNTGTNGAESLKKRLESKLNGLILNLDDESITLSTKVGLSNIDTCKNYEALLEQAKSTLSAPALINHPF